MDIKNIFKKISSNKCQHLNVKWMEGICMIAGYKKEGICLDCGAQLLKDSEGKVTNK